MANKRQRAKARQARIAASDALAQHWAGCQTIDSIEILERNMSRASEAQRKYHRISHISYTKKRFSTI